MGRTAAFVSMILILAGIVGVTLWGPGDGGSESSALGDGLTESAPAAARTTEPLRRPEPAAAAVERTPVPEVVPVVSVPLENGQPVRHVPGVTTFVVVDARDGSAITNFGLRVDDVKDRAGLKWLNRSTPAVLPVSLGWITALADPGTGRGRP